MSFSRIVFALAQFSYFAFALVAPEDLFNDFFPGELFITDFNPSTRANGYTVFFTEGPRGPAILVGELLGDAISMSSQDIDLTQGNGPDVSDISPGNDDTDARQQTSFLFLAQYSNTINTVYIARVIVDLDNSMVEELGLITLTNSYANIEIVTTLFDSFVLATFDSITSCQLDTMGSLICNTAPSIALFEQPVRDDPSSFHLIPFGDSSGRFFYFYATEGGQIRAGVAEHNFNTGSPMNAFVNRITEISVAPANLNAFFFDVVPLFDRMNPSAPFRDVAFVLSDLVGLQLVGILRQEQTGPLRVLFPPSPIPGPFFDPTTPRLTAISPNTFAIVYQNPLGHVAVLTAQVQPDSFRFSPSPLLIEEVSYLFPIAEVFQPLTPEDQFAQMALIHSNSHDEQQPVTRYRLLEYDANAVPPGPDGDNNNNNNDGGGDNIGAIIGVVIGGLIVLCCCTTIIVLVVCLVRRRDRPDSSNQVAMESLPEDKRASRNSSKDPYQPVSLDSHSSRPNRGETSSTMTDLALIAGEVRIKKEIGQGIGGKVYLGQWSGKKVAIKELSSGDLEEFKNEAMLLTKLQNPNVVRYYGIHQKGEAYYMVLEYVKNGSLLDVIKKNRDVLTDKQYFYMCYSSASGMQYLESSKVVHRDLACRNILCKKIARKNLYECKIADFGLSRELSYEVYSAKSKRPIPVRWTAPEIFTQGQSTSKSDVWAWAVTCWEIYQGGLLPYADLANKDVIEEVANGRRLNRPKNCPKKLYKLLNECWSADPKLRPSFVEIVSRLDRIADKLQFQFRSSSSSSSSEPEAEAVPDKDLPYENAEHPAYAQQGSDYSFTPNQNLPYENSVSTEKEKKSTQEDYSFTPQPHSNVAYLSPSDDESK